MESGLDPGVIQQFDNLRVRAHRKARAHYLAGRSARKLHLLLGIPALTASTIVGTAIFATLSSSPAVEWRIATGIISISAAVLATLQTFFHYSDLSDEHRLVGAKYAGLYRKLAAYPLQMGSTPQTSVLQKLDEFLDQFNNLESESPDVPDSLYDQAVREQVSDPEGV